MALYDTTWYINFGDGSTTGHYAVAKRPQNTAVVAGQLVRQFTAPSVGNERVFVCIVAGTTANVTDATWVLTRGAKTTDGTATWQECTGQASLNGDLVNTATWAQVKAVTPAVLGQVIKRSSGASYQICTTAGAMSASEPAFSDTAGVTTTDTTAVWTSLGPVGNFTGGQAPHKFMFALFAANWFASGNTIYIGDNHAEVLTGTYTLNLSSALMARVICHNHSGSYPPAASDMTTGAIISSTTAFSLSFSSSCYFYGITFKSLNGGMLLGTGAYQSWYYFDNCSFWISGSGAGIGLGDVGTGNWFNIVFDNCTVKFDNVNQYICPRNCQFTWCNTGQVLVSGSSVPTNLFSRNTGLGPISTVVLEAIDLSQLTGSLFTNTGFPSIGPFTIKDCKLNASATITTPVNSGATVQLVRCDSGATAYKSARYAYEGTETTETSITRVGGASDPTGQAQTRKIVTTANTQWLRPFMAEPYAIWNPTTGSNVTVTVCGTINSASLPNNDDIWLEIEYPGSSAAPLGTIITTTKASLLASNAAVASDSSTWNGGGSGAGWSPFKLVATLSSPQPGLVGYIHARVRVGKASATYYIDPQITLT